jgi:hypothetical protein
MKTNEMKTILHNKLKDENCYFSLSDIEIKKVDYNHIEIIITDYKPYSFIMEFSKDEIFGYIVTITMYYKNFSEKLIAFEDSQKDYPITSALIELGYYIGTRF